MFYNMKRNTKIKDYFAAKSRKSESSGIMDDLCMAFFLFCILPVVTDDVLTVHNLNISLTRTISLSNSSLEPIMFVNVLPGF
jgi:hypothetical protein